MVHKRRVEYHPQIWTAQPTTHSHPANRCRLQSTASATLGIVLVFSQASPHIFSILVIHTPPFLSNVQSNRSFFVSCMCFTTHAGIVVRSESVPARTGVIAVAVPSILAMHRLEHMYVLSGCFMSQLVGGFIFHTILPYDTIRAMMRNKAQSFI